MRILHSNHTILPLLAFFLFIHKGYSQETVQKTVQPKIMVIPFTKSDRTIEQELNINPQVKLGISKVKEAFDRRNFPTVDALAKLRILQSDKAMELENQSSVKQQIIESSGADIYVEVETLVNRSDGGNSITVILSAYDAFSGISLGNRSGVSPKFFTESFEKLIEKSLDVIIDDFMNLIQLKFDDINVNGRIISMNITFDENSKYNMDYELADAYLLSDKIEEWLNENAYNSQFHVQGTTQTKMIIDELRIPLKINGKNYLISQFVQKFRSFLKELNIESNRDINGGRIYITII